MDHETDLAMELKDLITGFMAGESGINRCSAWWDGHEAMALMGSELSRFKVMGAIGALCVWIGGGYTNETAVNFLSLDEHYEKVAEDLPVLLDLARTHQTPESSQILSDKIWTYITTHPSGDARLMFGALISMMRPLLDQVGDGIDMGQVAHQELINAAQDEESLRRIWNALVDNEGDMIVQSHALIALAEAAIAKRGPAQYPGSVNVDACGFIGYQIASFLASGDEDQARQVAAAFLMTVPYADSWHLAQFFAQHAT